MQYLDAVVLYATTKGGLWVHSDSLLYPIAEKVGCGTETWCCGQAVLEFTGTPADEFRAAVSKECERLLLLCALCCKAKFLRMMLIPGRKAAKPGEVEPSSAEHAVLKVVARRAKADGSFELERLETSHEAALRAALAPEGAVGSGSAMRPRVGLTKVEAGDSKIKDQGKAHAPKDDVRAATASNISAAVRTKSKAQAAAQSSEAVDDDALLDAAIIENEKLRQQEQTAPKEQGGAKEQGVQPVCLTGQLPTPHSPLMTFDCLLPIPTAHGV